MPASAAAFNAAYKANCEQLVECVLGHDFNSVRAGLLRGYRCRRLDCLAGPRILAE